MNRQDCMELLLTRRSVRRFTSQPISREDLEAIANAAIHAPSAMNRQTWQFTVTQDKAKIARLAKVIGEVLGREGYDIYDPAALIITSNLRSGGFGSEDNACALENIFLAAHALGIGLVWINQLRGICDEPRIRAVLREMQIPDDHVVFGMAALGYADGEAPAARPRKEGYAVVF